jgi:molybdopterin synthase sulfur carrier subunit
MVRILVMGTTLRDAVEESDVELYVEGSTSVKKLIEGHQEQLGGLLRYIANREALITVNKKIGTEDTAVRDGDIVKISFQSRASYDGTRDIPT